MGEIKLHKSFDTELAGLRSASDLLSKAVGMGGKPNAVGMRTLEKLCTQLDRIQLLVGTYQMLLKKDTADMEQAAASLETADKSAGNRISSR